MTKINTNEIIMVKIIKAKPTISRMKLAKINMSEIFMVKINFKK